tara:strand:+ start:175 stop:582 length:408 start_codon:yes stop_codon:yes gene_type:complete
MTVKPETRLWKSLKKCLKDGNYLVSRLESYVTPGFPDCLIFHNVTGFFTLELKVVNRNNKVTISPFQNAWNVIHAIHGAPVFILVGGLRENHVKLFHGAWTKDLGQKTVDQVPGLYEGRLADLDLVKLLNSQTPQ